MSTDNLRPDVNFLYEMGNIRFIERTWRRFLRDDFANLAEHHFRVFWIAMIIASHEENVDTGKLAKLILVHDIAESRTGDADYLSSQYTNRNEELAIRDILKGTGIEEEFLALWEEYEEHKTIESQIAKDADRLDVDFELAEQAAKGSQLQDLWRENRDIVAEHQLYTETAKKLKSQLLQTSPHEWHLTARNRRNDEDGEWAQYSNQTTEDRKGI